MPNGIRIHSGTVNIVACDIDGYAAPSVEPLGDTAVCTVNVVDSLVGGSRYDTLGNRIAESANGVIQDSKHFNVAPDRVNLHLTRVKVDPAVEAATGSSIRVGSTVIDQFTQSGTSFIGAPGTPKLQVFEDFPTLAATGLASNEAFGSSSIKIRTTLIATSLATDEAIGTSPVLHNIRLTAVGIPSSESLGIGTGVTTAGRVVASSLTSDQAFGASVVSLLRTIATTGIPSSEVFGVATIRILVDISGIPSDEAFGTASITLKRKITGVGIPTSEAFGASVVAPERFIVASSIPSSEALGLGLVSVGEGAADTIPESLAPGRLVPSGTQLEGTVITATIGEWSGFPHESRFVWNSDGVAVLDTGWMTDTWESKYTLAASDVNHSLTVDQQTRTPAGAGPPATATGSVITTPLHLPPSFADHTAVFGEIVTVSDVWNALQDTMKLWFPTYLREQERLSGRSYAVLRRPVGWRVFTESLDTKIGDQFPVCVIVAPGIATPLTGRENSLYSAVFEMGVSVIVKARDVSETLSLAAQYGAAMRKIILDHGSLGGLASGTTILGEDYNEIPDESQRTLAAAQLIVSIRVDNAAAGTGGPLEPEEEPPEEDSDPGGPTFGTVATTVLDLERV